MRIAIVTESYEPTSSTVATVVRSVLAELSAAAHDVIVIAPGRGPTTSAGFPVIRVGAICGPALAGSPRVGLPAARRVESILGEFDADVVVLAAPVVLGAAGALAAHRIGVPSVALLTAGQVAAGNGRRSWTMRARADWCRWVHALTARTLVPSDQATDSLRGQGFSRVATWRSGIDLEQFAPGRRDGALRATLGAPRYTLVGYAGADVGHDIALLPSLAAVPDARLVTMGPSSAELRRKTPSAAHLGRLGGRDLEAAVASLDILVSAGGSGPGSGVLAALASGVPVVASSAGDAWGLVRHGDNGLLVTPGSPRALAHATALLVRDHGLRTTLAGRARPSVADRSWSAATLALLGHLRQVTGIPDPTAIREVLAA